MNLNQWAMKWEVPYAALEDLRREMGLIHTDPPGAGHVPGSEAANQVAVRLEASRQGWRLWRNNVGATQDENGNFIRFGLANDSKQMNKLVKSADLIGIQPIRIKPYHIGRTIGQFVSREIKADDWIYSGTPREVAQSRWAELVLALGGDAAIVKGVL
jgi:hypothetical protein